jgi:ubiquinone/menaquinone biosynthesis C-methylase UbiE
MLLNRIEKALINNPVRAAVQRYVEATVLERLGRRVEGGRVLEIGCGRGIGVEILFERFGAREVHAFDLDPDMVERARERHASRPPERMKLWVGSATKIDAADGAYDAVFDFGIIHHVPEWRSAVSEVARVLRPSGRFYFEEVTKHALDRWSYRTFLDHPKHDRFTANQFIDEVERAGIVVGSNFIVRFFGDFVIGVGTRV